MSILVTLAMKDLRLLVRDRMALFWSLGFPLLMALFFGSIFGGGSETQAIGIAVVDEDATGSSKALVERLTSSDALEVQQGIELAEAQDRVRRGKLPACLRIPKGFGDGMAPFGGGPGLELSVDPSRRAERGMLQGVITAALFQSLQDRFDDPRALQAKVKNGLAQLPQDPGQDAALRPFLASLDKFLGEVEPAKFNEGIAASGVSGGSAFDSAVKIVEVARDETGQPRTPWDITFPSGILWGVLGCSATFAFALVRERLSGTLMRLRVAPLSRTTVLAGKALGCFAALCVVMTMLLAIGHFAMRMRVGSLPLLVLAVLATAACFTGIMMLLSTCGRTVQAVSGLGWGANLVMSMTGGGMIPLAFMPPWLRTVSHFSPVKWSILSLEGAIWRDFSPAEMLPPCAVLVAVGIAAFALGAWIDSRREL